MVDDAQKARPHNINQRVVEVKRATPREVSPVSTKLLLPSPPLWLNTEVF